MQTCGADPRGVRVKWRDGGRRTRLLGVTELGRMMRTDPNLARSVLDGLGRWEAGRSGGGMDPRRKGWGRLQARAGETMSSSSSSSTTSSGGEDTTPPKAPNPPPPKAPKKKPRHFESNDEEAPPPPQPNRASPRPRPSPGPRARAKPPPPKTPSPPLARWGRDPYGNVPGLGDTRYVPWAEGGNGGTVIQVMVLGDGDEELDPGEWWVVSQGSNGEGEGGKKGKKGKKRKREKEGGSF